MVGIAQTGSGKTLAVSLKLFKLLKKLNHSRFVFIYWREII